MAHLNTIFYLQSYSSSKNILHFKQLLDELGSWEIKDEEGCFYGIYEH